MVENVDSTKFFSLTPCKSSTSSCPLKATWEPTVSENQSMLWYLSVNFMSLFLRTISSAQWCMQKSCGAAGLSGSISAVAVYNWVYFHADHFSLGTISFGHNHCLESKCSQTHVAIRVTGHLALHGAHKDTGQLHLNSPLIQIAHEGFSSMKFLKLWNAKCCKCSHWLSVV